MKYRVRLQLFFNRLKRRYRVGRDRGLFAVSGLIRTTARQSMRIRGKSRRAVRGRFRRTGSTGSPAGTPPYAYIRTGIREINFDVQGSHSIIGPRKFRNSKFFDRPVTNIHEKGGIAVAAGARRRYTARYPERSYMWSAVKSLQSQGKIQSRFNITLARSW